VTPQDVAVACRDAMWQGDRASQWLGMAVVAAGPGTATVTMTVRAEMVNGHGVAHGGLVATLADSAFAVACNAYNEVTVAAGFDVNLLAAARLGDVLTAVAAEVHKGGAVVCTTWPCPTSAGSGWQRFAGARAP
jgi:acyl-CoA thioesterase